MSADTARVVDEEVARLVNQAHDRAREILQRERDLLGRLSDVLVEREAIDGKELRKFVDGELPIPTKEDLVQEGLERREEERERAMQPASGPSIISSLSGESRATEPDGPMEQIPA